MPVSWGHLGTAIKLSRIHAFYDLVLTTIVASFPAALPAATHKTQRPRHAGVGIGLACPAPGLSCFGDVPPF